MKNKTILITVLFALTSCGWSCTQQQNAEARSDWSLFIGRWDQIGLEEGEYFQLEFRSQDDSTVNEVSFSVLGPFEEILRAKAVSERQIELYFEFLMMAHRETPDDKTLAECRGQKVADCTINPDGTMVLEIYTDKCGMLPANTTILLQKKGADVIYGLEEEEEEDSGRGGPVDFLSNYTPEQLQQLIGKTEPHDVRDFLALIPAESCFNYSVEERQKLMQGKGVGEFSGVQIGEHDAKNGYLNLVGPFEGIWEMFAKKINEIWWIAVNQQFCGPLCYTYIANTYMLFPDGDFLQSHEANLAGYQDVWLELFLDLEQLSSEQQKQAKEAWEESRGVLFQLPRDGKTITMYIDPLPYLDNNIPESAFRKISVEIWAEGSEAVE